VQLREPERPFPAQAAVAADALQCTMEQLDRMAKEPVEKQELVEAKSSANGFFLLRLEPQHRYAVLEMGAQWVGELAWLCNTIARPNWSIITNVGAAHLGIFGSQEQVALAKSELVQALTPTFSWISLTLRVPGQTLRSELLRHHQRWGRLPVPKRHRHDRLHLNAIPLFGTGSRLTHARRGSLGLVRFRRRTRASMERMLPWLRTTDM